MRIQILKLQKPFKENYDIVLYSLHVCRSIPVSLSSMPLSSVEILIKSLDECIEVIKDLSGRGQIQNVWKIGQIVGMLFQRNVSLR